METSKEWLYLGQVCPQTGYYKCSPLKLCAQSGSDTIAITHISVAIKYQTPIIWFALPEKETEKGITAVCL